MVCIPCKYAFMMCQWDWPWPHLEPSRTSTVSHPVENVALPVVDIDMFPGPAFLLAADMPQNVVLPRSGYRYPCWALGGHVGPMLGHVVPVLNLRWAKNGVFLEAIWGLGWAYAGGKRMVCWAHVGSRYAAMLGVVVNCQETHTHSIRPEHCGMFHSQFASQPCCYTYVIWHGSSAFNVNMGMYKLWENFSKQRMEADTKRRRKKTTWKADVDASFLTRSPKAQW